MKKIFTLLSAALLTLAAAAQQKEYTDGVFVINEDQFGIYPSSVNFLNSDGTWDYNVFQTVNPGHVLGATACYGTIADGKMYIMSKQAQNPSSSVPGGRITVCDAKTMKMISQTADLKAPDESETADARSFCFVGDDKAYVSSSNGIYVYNTATNTVTGKVSGSENDDNNLYTGQTGSMVFVDGKVYAVHQDLGLLVIDVRTDRIVKTINTEAEGYSYGSVVRSKDGMLWLSVAESSGSGNTLLHIVRLDPSTDATSTIDMPDGIYAPANSWYAWTPDCFCASSVENALFWNGGKSSWTSNQSIFKYDIDKGEFSQIIDLSKDDPDYYIYGSSCRVQPTTGNLYLGMTVGNPYGNKTVERVYDSKGTKLNEYPLEDHYWFPGIPVFPETTSTGIDHTGTSDAQPVETARFTVDGKRIQSPQRGINIVRYSDGSVRKTVVR